MKLKLDRRSQRPLFEQLRDGINHAIDSGVLKPGDRLPSVSALSKQHRVTQATILRAFADLTEAGRVDSHVGRGTFVRQKSEQEKEPAPESRPKRTDSLDPEFFLTARRLRMGVAKSLEVLQVLAQRPGMIALTAGVPDASIAADGILARHGHEALKLEQSLYQGYGNHLGLLELREAIARRYDPSGTKISAEQVLITSGSQQAVSLLAQYALEQKQRVICEVPCYMGVPNAFGAIGHWVESLPRDKDGPILERLNRFRDGRSSMLYVCPEMHNPMGTDLHPERLAGIVEWARSQDSVILADEIFRELRIDGPAVPSMLDVCDPERTIVIGSLSKAFMCGLRVGWLITSVERVRGLIGLKRAMDISCPTLMQGVAASLLRSGDFDEHLKRAREHYRVRRDAALDALQRHMPPGVVWTKPSGGFHLWVELPAGYSSIALYMLATERGVAIAPGPQMDIDHRFVSGFRLSYGSLDVATIQQGIALLGEAVKKLLAAPPDDPGLSGLGGYL